jgi:hypothetical protein
MLLYRAGDPQERRFAAAPAFAPDAPEPGPRRIWDVDEQTLVIVVGVLLDRRELQALFRDMEHDDRKWFRDDALLLEAVSRCSRAGRFAEVVERLLDRRTRRLRVGLDGGAASELAGLWLGARERVSGRELAALLWSLARDRRWVVRGLFERVRGDIWVRALRLLGERAEGPVSSSEPTARRDTGAQG